MTQKKFIRSNPHLTVKNLCETLDYYKNVLGFEDEWTWTNQDGKITDGGIRRDDMRLLFAEDPDFTKAINNKAHRLPLMWFVENIDNVFAEFQKRSIEITDGLRTHPSGLREFSFVDINGYYIRVAEMRNDE